MKKNLFILLLIFPLIASAQLKIQVGGFVFENGEKFKVVKNEGVSAQELFNRCKNTLLGMTINLDNMSSENEGQMIVVSGKSSGDCYYKYMGQTVLSDIDYTIRIQFKDGRYRIDAPSISKVTSGVVPIKFEAGGRMKDGFGLAFKKDGSPRLGDLILSIEQYFNSIYESIEKGIASGVDNDW